MSAIVWLGAIDRCGAKPMRSLLIRIFLSFWLMIVVTIIVAAAMGAYYAERARAAIETFEVSEAMLDASASLQRDGRAGLTAWLESLPGVTQALVYVLDRHGRDLLARPLPRPVKIAVRRFGGVRGQRQPARRDFGNLRPARPFTELVGPDGHVYTLFVLPPKGVVGRWLADRGRASLFVLALIVSAVVSYLLARAISTPIRRLRESATSIAGGDFSTRVAERIGKRRDEIGLLGRDFDRMAGELQRASERQTELTRNVSHELRSPLARLRVALELARRRAGELPEFEKIDRETERLDDLIGQILEFSRFDAEVREQRSRLDLGEVVASIVEDVRYEYASGEHEVEIGLQIDDACTVEVHPSALNASVENVLRNAAQHGRAQHGQAQHGQTGGKIEVRVFTDGPDALVSVCDDGGGVVESELPKLFEPFYRASNRRDHETGKGSGLGLAIASRAAVLNGGSITATNQARGLRVTIRIPLAGA